MDEQTIFLRQGEREVGKKLSLGSVKLTTRPLDNDLSLDIESLAAVADRAIMVAAHRRGTVGD
jgi:hypothetical protein